MTGTNDSRDRETVRFLVSGRTMPVRSFTFAACSSRAVRLTGRRWGEREGILRVFRQPLERHTKLTEFPCHGSAHEPFVLSVGGEVQHAAVHEDADGLPLIVRGQEPDDLQAVPLVGYILLPHIRCSISA